MKRFNIFTLFLMLFLSVFDLLGKVFYIAPDVTGDGTEESSPMGLLSEALGLLKLGDTLILLDGEYTEPLILKNIKGTQKERITIKANNICGAFVNGEVKKEHAVEVIQSI